MTQPTEDLIIWANTDVNLPKLAGPNKTKPIDDLINKGWDFTENPAADEFNYIFNNLGQWIDWTVTDIESGTSSNTPNTLVRRGGSGNFSAGIITASLSGNASTASKWTNARTLTFTGSVTGSVSIDGSGDVSLVTSISSSNGVSILTGTIAHGATIPLPSGYSSDQCRWFVSINSLGVKNDNTLDTMQCYASSSRVVICQMLGTDADTITGTANYIIIGVK